MFAGPIDLELDELFSGVGLLVLIGLASLLAVLVLGGVLLTTGTLALHRRQRRRQEDED